MAALAHGRPVVSTEPVVQLPELKHRENAYLVARGDPRAIAEAVVTLREDPVLAARLGAGAEKLAQHFRWATIAGTTVAFLEHLRTGD